MTGEGDSARNLQEKGTAAGSMGALEEIVDIAYPQQPHCPTVLVLDTSASMAGFKIDQLNSGLAIFKDELVADELARKRVDIAVISFGKGVNVVHSFSSIEDFPPPVLEADGFTPMGKAISAAIEMVEKRKKEYRDTGVDYYRPWIFLITDGHPTDMQPGDNLWNEVISRVHNGERDKKFLFWALGVDKANIQILSQITPPTRPPLMLKETHFAEMFVWLSKSLATISDSRIGEQITIENPTGPQGWGSVPT
ncbi:MAG: VWA domain-containing protein [Methanomicrobiales archaeon]|nr:VWA domain-containing protein [Methanomicrobiales archaeon]